MAMTNPAKRLAQRNTRSARGPVVAFACTVLLTLAVLATARVLMPSDFVMPVVSSMFFLFATIVALIAWRVSQALDHDGLSYWDVAGALTLFGIFSGILIEPEQLVRLIETQHDAR